MKMKRAKTGLTVIVAALVCLVGGLAACSSKNKNNKPPAPTATATYYIAGELAHVPEGGGWKTYGENDAVPSNVKFVKGNSSDVYSLTVTLAEGDEFGVLTQGKGLNDIMGYDIVSSSEAYLSEADSGYISVEQSGSYTFTLTAGTSKALTYTCTPAQSKPTTYTVTFYLNDGTTATHDSKTVESGTAVIKPANPSRDGYTFLGWSTNDKATAADYEFGTAVTGETKLYAVWQKNAPPPTTYSVTFYLNDGTTDTHDAKTVESGTAVTKPADPSRDGYTFLGWSTNDKATTADYEFGTAVTGETKLYAVWQKNAPPPTTYSVTFYLNDGTATAYETKTVESGDLVSAPSSNPSRDGYTFLGWSTNEDSATADYNFSMAVTGETKLYAVWQKNAPPPTTYSVTFYLNDGTTNTHDSKTVESGTAVTKPADPSRTGYDFLGWSTNKDSTTADYDFSTTITGATNLYAVWQIKTFAVTFYYNYAGADNDGIFEQNTVDYNTAVMKPADPSRDGYTFLGWSTNDKATTADYNFSTPITGATSLYAVWQIKTYSVTFYINDGTTDTHDSKTIDHGAAVTKPADPSRTGYTFLGWSANKDSTTADYDFSTSITGAMDIYAVWVEEVPPTPTSYFVKFYLNDGTATAYETKTVESGDPVSAPSSNPSRTGYDFLGWSANKNATTADYNFGTPITQATGIYAVWQIKTYSVTFYLNDGTADTHDSKTVEHGAAVSAPESNPSRDNYNFLGWSANDKATTADYNFGTAITGATNLYAVWQIKTYSVTFYINDGTTDTHDAKTVEHGAAVTAPSSNPARTGYNFLGWSANDKATTADYNFGTAITQATGIYAVWQIKTYSVTFYINDGTTNTHDSKTVEHGAAVTAPSSNPARTGYTFLGWSANDKATTADYNFGTAITGTTNLYAVWEEIEYDEYYVYYELGTNSKRASDKITYSSVNGCYTASVVISASSTNGFGFKLYTQEQLDKGWDQKTYVAPISFTNGGAGYEPDIIDNTSGALGYTWEDTDGVHRGNNFWFLGANNKNYKFTIVFDEDGVVVSVKVDETADMPSIVYTVTFDANGGNWDGETTKTLTLRMGESIYDNLPDNPTKANYKFGGWGERATSTGALDLTAITVSDDVTYYVVWKNLDVYSVTFFANYKYVNAAAAADTTYFKQYTITEGGSVTEYTPTAAQSKYTFGTSTYFFDGWYTSEACTTAYVFDGSVQYAAVNLYAKWRAAEIYTVTFDYNYEGSPASFGVAATEGNSGLGANMPANPANYTDEEGTYKFAGWFYTDSEVSADPIKLLATTVITKSFTVTAQWTKEQTLSVKFNLNYETSATIADDEVLTGQKVTKPHDPARTGFRFNGWYIDPELAVDEMKFDFDVAINVEDYAGDDYALILYANWVELTEYTVTFDLDGASGAYDDQYIYEGDTVFEPLNNPFKPGYHFEGWYVADVAFDFSAALTAEQLEAYGDESATITLVAKYSPLTQFTVSVSAEGVDAQAVVGRLFGTVYEFTTETFEVDGLSVGDEITFTISTVCERDNIPNYVTVDYTQADLLTGNRASCFTAGATGLTCNAAGSFSFILTFTNNGVTSIVIDSVKDTSGTQYYVTVMSSGLSPDGQSYGWADTVNVTREYMDEDYVAEVTYLAAANDALCIKISSDDYSEGLVTIKSFAEMADNSWDDTDSWYTDVHKFEITNNASNIVFDSVWSENLKCTVAGTYKFTITFSADCPYKYGSGWDPTAEKSDYPLTVKSLVVDAVETVTTTYQAVTAGLTAELSDTDVTRSAGKNESDKKYSFQLMGKFAANDQFTVLIQTGGTTKHTINSVADFDETNAGYFTAKSGKINCSIAGNYLLTIVYYYELNVVDVFVEAVASTEYTVQILNRTGYAVLAEGTGEGGTTITLTISSTEKDLGQWPNIDFRVIAPNGTNTDYTNNTQSGIKFSGSKYASTGTTSKWCTYQDYDGMWYEGVDGGKKTALTGTFKITLSSAGAITAIAID